MRPANLAIFGHLGIAVARYVKELERDGFASPPELLWMMGFCDQMRQGATSLDSTGESLDAGSMTQATILTKREAATELRLSVRQVERLIAADKLAAVKVESSTRIRRVDLRAYIDSLGPSRSFRDSLTEKGIA